MPRMKHEGSGPFSKGNKFCGAMCTLHLGRPYFPEPALSALRMLREQGITGI